MKPLKVLVIMDADLVPPLEMPKNLDRDTVDWTSEYDVVTTLREIGHEVLPLGVRDDPGEIRGAIHKFQPDITYNLMVEFHREAMFDHNVVSYLELLKAPYTGCNPRGLVVARDKAWTKMILAHAGIKVPRFQVFRRKQRLKVQPDLPFPMIVKCLFEEASLGISQASIVHNEEKLLERVQFLHESVGADAIAEEFIKGKELYMGVLGNNKLHTLPPWELAFAESENPESEIYTSRAKFSAKYRKKHGITTNKSRIDSAVASALERVCKSSFRALSLSGYARIDLRMNDANEIFVLDVNPNPDISIDDEFALSAQAGDWKYSDLLEKILSLGLSWHARTFEE